LKKETEYSAKQKGKNVKQHSATQTHKVQLLHAAVHAHRICDSPGTDVADVIASL
jgi:hypothetical protein